MHVVEVGSNSKVSRGLRAVKETKIVSRVQAVIEKVVLRTQELFSVNQRKKAICSRQLQIQGCKLFWISEKDVAN